MLRTFYFILLPLNIFTFNLERNHQKYDGKPLEGGFFDRISNSGDPEATFHFQNLSRHKLKDVFEHERNLSPFNRFSSLSEGKGSYCKRPAKCELLNYTTCLGVKLPYSRTSLELVDGLTSQEQGQEQLKEWRRLVHIPKCWAVIQPFLCALYMPKCDDSGVYLPSQEMCKMIMGPCRILTSFEPWPAVFRCDNQTRYPPMCKNDVRELKFNTTGRCLEPLVQTDLSAWYYDGVDGCGVQCNDPMYTDHQRQQIHKLVAWGASICALFNLFTIVTFMIDWKFSSKYPALVIFYINFCFLIVCIGWLAQFLPGGREDIVCRKDGTLRTAEPSAGENLSCVVVYVMVYYFLMAGIAWFVILTYAWHISLQALGKIQECMEKKGAYFHLVAWSLPLVLTITTMALGEIDGDGVTGICFVGSANKEYRAGFLLLPVAAALIVGTYFLSKGLIILIKLQVDSKEIISERANNKIKETILRMGIFSVLILVLGATTFIWHVYHFKNSEVWSESFRIYILCKLGIGESGPSGECKMGSRPSVAMLQLHVLSLFSVGVLMSSWVWTHTTINTWATLIARLLKKEVPGNEKQTKPKKHKLIAQAYSKRKKFNSDGHISISFHSSHKDPVGLNIELNSGATGSVRSSWAAALPKLLTRRGALVAATNSNSSVRRNSVDSQISYSVRRVSVESRRHSVDSAVSVKVSEVTQTLVKKVTKPRHKSHRSSRIRRHSRNKGTKQKSNSGTTKPSRNSGSASSGDSNVAMKLIMALAESGGVGGGIKSNSRTSLKALGYTGVPCKPNTARRGATAGLEGEFAMLADRLLRRGSADSNASSSSRRSVELVQMCILDKGRQQAQECK
ncbi:hypothetical protein O3M35_009082 [Rhynocoris fuscipes]|uniref:Protein smoothened n=1 Tax=Rhynocoris fuscipes TaxID=488301 RepID=A0AAW1D4N1_9HEMI